LESENYIIKRITFKELIESLKTYLPVVYLIFLIISITIKASFFSHYGVNIFSYIELSEYLIYFFVDFSDLVISLITAYSFCYISFNILDITCFALKIKSKHLSTINIIGIGIAIVLSILFLSYLKTPKYYWIDILIGCITWMSYNSNLKGANKSKGFVKNDVSQLIIWLIISMVVITYYKNEEVQSNSQIVKIQLKSNELIETSTNIKLIGETKNYIFIYNNLNSLTQVIKRDQIKNISFGKGKPIANKTYK
jgi:hypothetical protein